MESKPPHRLSNILHKFKVNEEVRVGDIPQLLGDRAVAALMFVFALPNIVPTPPGTSAVLGLPLVVFSIHVMLGRQAVWLPNRIANRMLGAALVRALKTKGLPWLVGVENVLKPRFAYLVRSGFSQRFLGLICFLLAIILFLPILCGNILPAIVISVLALALIERDTLVALVG